MQERLGKEKWRTLFWNLSQAKPQLGSSDNRFQFSTCSSASADFFACRLFLLFTHSTTALISAYFVYQAGWTQSLHWLKISEIFNTLLNTGFKIKFPLLPHKPRKGFRLGDRKRALHGNFLLDFIAGMHPAIFKSHSCCQICWLISSVIIIFNKRIFDMATLFLYLPPGICAVRRRANFSGDYQAPHKNSPIFGCDEPVDFQKMKMNKQKS